MFQNRNGRTLYRWKHANWKRFRQLVKTNLPEFNFSDVHSALTVFNNIVLAAANRCCPRGRFKAQLDAWPTYIQQLDQEAITKEQFLSMSLTENHIAYQQADPNRFAAIRQYLSSRYQQAISKLHPGENLSWKFIAACYASPTPSLNGVLIRDSQKVCTSGKAVVNSLAKAFLPVFPPSKPHSFKRKKPGSNRGLQASLARTSDLYLPHLYRLLSYRFISSSSYIGFLLFSFRLACQPSSGQAIWKKPSVSKFSFLSLTRFLISNFRFSPHNLGSLPQSTLKFQIRPRKLIRYLHDASSSPISSFLPSSSSRNQGQKGGVRWFCHWRGVRASPSLPFSHSPPFSSSFSIPFSFKFFCRSDRPRARDASLVNSNPDRLGLRCLLLLPEGVRLHNLSLASFLGFSSLEDPDPHLDESFTLTELKAALHSALSSKAPGPDKIHYELLTQLSNESLEFFLQIMNLSFSTGELPAVWKMACIFPLLKPSKDPASLSSYRPISLISCTCKLFEKMITTRLLRIWKPHDCQHAFRSLHTTIMPLTRITDTIERSRNEYHEVQIPKKMLPNSFQKHYRLNPTLIVMIDFSKAFDSIDHN
ncbi:unnamed protein product [Phytomonas sp. EM1]|nr:unnamed protein product [Phytomonas sp. EM1]|eukprot:CCW65285.1 unnamed protein product [Phytomonas sp. isolate EM1]